MANVIADLIQKGHIPCVPLSEHQSFDLVAVLRNKKTIRLQVKYASLKHNGSVEVRFRTGWVDKHGMHMRRYKPSDFDYFALYCPQREVVLYVANDAKIPSVLRFTSPGNNQGKHIAWARDYLEL